jgi:phage terminase large subunit
MIIRFDNGSEILCVAIVDTARAEAASRIKSLTDITDIWIEEPNDLTLDEFEMIKLRLRGEELESGYRQIILTFNPVNKTHWLYEEFNFAGKAPPGVERQHYTYEDNEFVDQAFKEYLRTGIKDKNRHKVYALGEWGELGELVYENYTDKIFGYTYDYFDVLIAGVDFGFSNSPNAFALFGMMEDSFELYVINEVYEFGTMTRDFIDSIKTQLKDYIPERMIKEIPMYCDSARPEAIEEMRRAELNVFPAKKDVLDGINTVRQFQIYVHPDCPSFLREIQGYVRQKDAKGNALEMPDKQAGFDHLCDSLRYACHSWMMSKKKQISGVVPIMGKIATRERMY